MGYNLKCLKVDNTTRLLIHFLRPLALGANNNCANYWHTGYFLPEKRSHQFRFSTLFRVRSPYVTDRRTDGRTGGQDS